MLSTSRRSRPTGPLLRLLAFISAMATTSVVLRSAGAAAAEQQQQQVFRCESEEDLDGSACRVDMLPDSALAEMVYERGFDAEGADRLQLLDAVMQLLDYEYATGEDLREMEYIPDDGSAAAAAETAAADLETAAANAAAAALAAEVEAEAAALAAAAASAGGGGGAGGEETGAGVGAGAEAGGSDGYGDAHSGFDERDREGEEAGNAEGYNEDQIAREVVEESSLSTSSSCAVGGGEGETCGCDVATDFEFDESTPLGYAHSLATEILSTMRRDMNYLVGLLPAPVAKPIREAATFVGDTATRFVAPALRQAERYTRGLRRGAGKAVGKAALVLKDDVLPSVGRGAKAAASKAKRRVGDAMAARKKKREEEEEDGSEQQQQQYEAPRD